MQRVKFNVQRSSFIDGGWQTTTTSVRAQTLAQSFVECKDAIRFNEGFRIRTCANLLRSPSHPLFPFGGTHSIVTITDVETERSQRCGASVDGGVHVSLVTGEDQRDINHGETNSI